MVTVYLMLIGVVLGGGVLALLGIGRHHLRRSPPPHEPLAGKVVFVADEDPGVVAATLSWLRQLGLTALGAPEGLVSLLAAHKVRPDLLIMDLRTPVGDGLMVCEMLAADPSLEHIPVILHTSHSDPRTISRCRELRAHYVERSAESWQQMRSLIGRLLAPGEEIPEAAAPAGYLSPIRPVADPAAQPSAAPSAPPQELPGDEESSALSGSRPHPLVLCIDDDPSILQVIAARLASYGVEVAQACSGMQGYWLALKRRPDVIITDLHMPDGEGNYVLARFRGHPLTKDVPVIVLTANDNPGTRRQLLSLGADAYLVKPLDFEDMLGHLREHIPIPEKAVTVG